MLFLRGRGMGLPGDPDATKFDETHEQVGRFFSLLSVDYARPITGTRRYFSFYPYTVGLPFYADFL